ncbi:MAG TPA: thioredoxin, partial [Verrucomicrobiales bacterium]|nr:thioredoxin [Verrucomicrobiales bacterium]
MASESILNLSAESFEGEVLESENPVLVDFWAEWCGPCKMIAPVLDELVSEYKDRLKICKVNIDDEQSIASKYGIRAIPTMLIFQNGEVA